MSRLLRPVSTREVIRALERAGFRTAPARGKGSHRAMVRERPDGRILLVIVPQRKSIPVGTLRAIIRQAGLTPAEFRDLL